MDKITVYFSFLRNFTQTEVKVKEYVSQSGLYI